jgi:hypothetical protein
MIVGKTSRLVLLSLYMKFYTAFKSTQLGL